MSKRIYYNCNLCHSDIKDDNYGRGIYWASERANDKLEIRQLANSENHLCNKCIKSIVKEFSQIGL